ncbi:MAG: hypothetical protein K1W18_07210 [Oscillospiraceae bacterium]
MRVRNEEYNLLVEICEFLNSEGSRKDLALSLKNVLSRFSDERKKANDRQRKAHAQNRENGYAWPSSYRPKKSKYYSKGDQDE